MTNRLAHSTSPYLLQHKDNPVDWWQWEPKAFAEAKRLSKPIFLSRMHHRHETVLVIG